MAINLIHDNHAAPGGRVPGEAIWELADRITDDLLECISLLKKAHSAIQPLTELIPDPVDEWEDAA